MFFVPLLVAMWGYCDHCWPGYNAHAAAANQQIGIRLQKLLVLTPRLTGNPRRHRSRPTPTTHIREKSTFQQQRPRAATQLNTQEAQLTQTNTAHKHPAARGDSTAAAGVLHKHSCSSNNFFARPSTRSAEQGDL